MANYKIFPLRLSDEDRDAMEAHRIRLGLRSGAETIRALLLTDSDDDGMEFVDISPENWITAQKAAVPLLSRKAFNPQPKPKKK